MAEQLAVEERRWKIAAGERDELFLAPQAQAMDLLRHHLLAGAGFTEDQDGAVGRGHMLDLLVDLLHYGAQADEGPETIPAADLLLEQLDVGPQLSSLQRLLHGDDQLLNV